MSDASRAVQMFRDGCACSQALLTVYGASLGLAHRRRDSHQAGELPMAAKSVNFFL